METVFRILCPADKLSSMIGHNGSIIRQISQQTHSTIDIDHLSSLPISISSSLIIHRLITIVSDSTPSFKFLSHDVSPAQLALIRLFERIVEATEEQQDQEDNNNNRMEVDLRPVVCRLLAKETHVGSVIGVGGKTVEKIRGESGAQVRVFGKDKVPFCAASGDQLIQISGSFSAVTKALISVSSCLQSNPQTEPPFGANLRGPAPPVPMDPYAQRSYLSSLRAPDYHSRIYSSNPGIDTTASRHIEVQGDDVIFRMLCSSDKVGSLIGKGGFFIKALQSETGASIKISDAITDSDERVIVISARENSELKHSPAQDAVLRVHSRLAEADVDKTQTVSAKLLVPAEQIGCLLGRGGTIIAEMRRTTGASIRIFVKEQVSNCAYPNDEVVQVTGTFQSVHDALLHITSRIRETFLPQKPYPGMPQYMSKAPEIPPLLRSRNEPPLRFSHGGDHPGFERAPFSYGNEPTGLRPSFDRPPSPRAWAPQIVSSGHPRDITDAATSLGFRSGLMGSGCQTPVVTSKTVEVVVPQHLIGFVHGEKDSNLTDIIKISGARVTIFDPNPGATEGMVIISGTSNQTSTAQGLLHAFILCGQSFPKDP